MSLIQKKKKTIAYFELVSGLFLFLILLLVLFTSALGNHQIFLVLIGFFPAILTIIISLLIHDQYEQHKKILWLLPLIIVGLFYVIGRANTNMIGGMDVDVLSGINFILGIIYVITIMSIFKDYKNIKTEKIKHNVIIDKKSKYQNQHPQKLENKSLNEYIHSIEDKSKALNFAIGRVYSQFHGGSKLIRDKIRIPKELYNEFSSIGISKNTINYKKLNEIIIKFDLFLANFEKTEKELFGKEIDKLKNLIRDIKGQDSIIKVLDHNDKDPVKSYYEGAKTFCERIRNEMNQKELKLVKNNYIPKDDENDKKKDITLNKPPEHLKKTNKAVKKTNSKNKTKKTFIERKPISNHP